MAADYFVRQGRDADGLAAELDTPEQRRRYIAQFYGHRFWATPGAFAPRGRRLHDRAVRRRREACAPRSGNYESAAGRAAAVRARRASSSATPCRRWSLYGPDDHVIWRRLPRALRGRSSPTSSARSSCRAPATSCSGSAPTCSNARVVTLLARPGRLTALYDAPPMADDSAPGPPGLRASRRASARVAAIVEAAEQAAADLREQTERRARERIAEADRAADLRVEAAEAEAARAARRRPGRRRGRARPGGTRRPRRARGGAARARRRRGRGHGRAAARPTQEAARVRAEAAEAAERTRANAREEARAVVHDARVAAGEVLARGHRAERRPARAVGFAAPQRRAADQRHQGRARPPHRRPRPGHARRRGPVRPRRPRPATPPRPDQPPRGPRARAPDEDLEVPEFLPPR